MRGPWVRKNAQKVARLLDGARAVDVGREDERGVRGHLVRLPVARGEAAPRGALLSRRIGVHAVPSCIDWSHPRVFPALRHASVLPFASGASMVPCSPDRFLGRDGGLHGESCCRGKMHDRRHVAGHRMRPDDEECCAWGLRGRRTTTPIVAGAGPAGIMAAREAADARPRPARRVVRPCRATRAAAACSTSAPRSSSRRSAPVPDDIILSPAPRATSATSTGTAASARPTDARASSTSTARASTTGCSTLLPDDVELVESLRASRRSTQDADGVARHAAGRPTAPLTVACENLDRRRRRPLARPARARHRLRRDVRHPPGLGARSTARSSRSSTASTCATSATASPTATSCRRATCAIVGSVFYPKTQAPAREAGPDARRCCASSSRSSGESVKREAWVALYVRSRGDVVPGAGRVLLAGEAGGFMSPTSGEGICYALQVGRARRRRSPSRRPADGARRATRPRRGRMQRDIAPQLRWLPFMESRVGKYLAGFVPDADRRAG